MPTSLVLTSLQLIPKSSIRAKANSRKLPFSTPELLNFISTLSLKLEIEIFLVAYTSLEALECLVERDRFESMVVPRPKFWQQDQLKHLDDMNDIDQFSKANKINEMLKFRIFRNCLNVTSYNPVPRITSVG